MDYKIMEHLMRSNQQQTKDFMFYFLSQHYRYAKNCPHYLHCKGTLPVALVAHLDTVEEHNRQRAQLYYDPGKQVMFCPGYPGFDDKAGLYAIIKIVQSGLKPHIYLCENEETSLNGAKSIAEQAPLRNYLKYFIELDRRGRNECVFYDCENPNFSKYITSFGFAHSSGTYSDISYICPSWGLAGVNLSVGYQNEHTPFETLHVSSLESTIEKVKNLLLDSKNLKEPFPYVHHKYLMKKEKP